MNKVTIFIATGAIGAGLVTPHSGDCRPTREICQVAPPDQVHGHDRDPTQGPTMPKITERASTASSPGPFNFVDYVVKR